MSIFKVTVIGKNYEQSAEELVFMVDSTDAMTAETAILTGMRCRVFDQVLFTKVDKL